MAVEHSYSGIVDFLAAITQSIAAENVSKGAVFFPEGNSAIGNDFDSRMQPWDRFDSTTEWHPMSYAQCGSGDSIVSQVRKVLDVATKSGAKPIKVVPVLAGSRPALETQMQAIAQALPEVNAVTHFAFSWQEIELDRSHQTCKQL